MKYDTFEAMVIAARPEGYKTYSDFTDTVMRAVGSTEILSGHIRRMDVNKKETFIMKLRHLPKLAVIAVAIGAVAVLGGTTYALYKTLWEQPHVTVETPTTNQFGRTQVIASLENCGDQTAASTFEIKSGSTLDPSEIGKILQARCEIDLVRTWTGETIGIGGANYNPVEGISTSEMTMVSPVASKVVSIDSASLSLTGDQYNTPKEPLALTSATQYIVDNHAAAQDKIQPGDSVLYIQRITSEITTKKTATGYSSSTSPGKPVNRVTTYVIKVTLPFEYYGPSKQNQIAQREPCAGNSQDSCVQTASVDLYMSSQAIMLKPDGADGFTNEMRSIQGILTEYNGNVLTMKSSSGRIFTLTTPSDIVSNFNKKKSANYNGVKVAVGDMLLVSYIVDKGYTSLSLDKSHIISIQLGLNLIQKSDAIKKY